MAVPARQISASGIVTREIRILRRIGFADPYTVE